MSEKSDIKKLTISLSCKYKKYKKRHLSHPLHRAELEFEAEITNQDRGTENVDKVNQAGTKEFCFGVLE